MSNEFRTIFTTGNPLEAAIVKALLEDNGIPCMVLNDGLQNLFGIGQFGVGFNPIIGDVKVQVSAEMEEEALRILKEAENIPPEGGEGMEGEGPGDQKPL